MLGGSRPAYRPVPDVRGCYVVLESVAPRFGPHPTLFLTIAGTVQWQHDGERWT